MTETTTLQAAGDRWRQIYETAVDHITSDPDGSLFAFCVELVMADQTADTLKDKTRRAVQHIAALRHEADRQNTIYRGDDFGKFIRQATGTPALRTLHKLAREVGNGKL